ncbi:hypothetical protein BJ742DRAFT_827447 [Cladochytrium replicatum]|nr:hypothetical protein BJ742DRAFT_827447 [Cladochytrium replicatum]
MSSIQQLAPGGTVQQLDPALATQQFSPVRGSGASIVSPAWLVPIDDTPIDPLQSRKRPNPGLAAVTPGAAFATISDEQRGDPDAANKRQRLDTEEHPAASSTSSHPDPENLQIMPTNDTNIHKTNGDVAFADVTANTGKIEGLEHLDGINGGLFSGVPAPTQTNLLYPNHSIVQTVESSIVNSPDVDNSKAEDYDDDDEEQPTTDTNDLPVLKPTKTPARRRRGTSADSSLLPAPEKGRVIIQPDGTECLVIPGLATVLRNDDKPYRCDIQGCEKLYRKLNGLISHHYSTHTLPVVGDPKPFKCSFPKCSKSYRNSNGLAYHIEKGHCADQNLPSLPVRKPRRPRKLGNVPGESQLRASYKGSKQPHLSAVAIAASQLPLPKLLSQDAFAEQDQEFDLDEEGDEHSPTPPSNGAADDESVSPPPQEHLQPLPPAPASPAVPMPRVADPERPYVCPYAHCGKSYKNPNGLTYHLQKSKEHINDKNPLAGEDDELA